MVTDGGGRGLAGCTVRAHPVRSNIDIASSVSAGSKHSMSLVSFIGLPFVVDLCGIVDASLRTSCGLLGGDAVGQFIPRA